MNYLYLTEDENGVSFFEDRAFDLSMRDFAPPAPNLLLSDGLPADRLVFLTLPAGWGGAQHPSPRNQIAVCLSGRLRVKAGSGETREFGAGAIWWMCDTRGHGHWTEVVGTEDVRLAITQLP